MFNEKRIGYFEDIILKNIKENSKDFPNNFLKLYNLYYKENKKLTTYNKIFPDNINFILGNDINYFKKIDDIIELTLKYDNHEAYDEIVNRFSNKLNKKKNSLLVKYDEKKVKDTALKLNQPTKKLKSIAEA